MTSRRSIIAAAATLLTTARSGFAAPRGVYDLDAINVSTTGPMLTASCSQATVTRLDKVARVNMQCFVTRPRKKKKRLPVGFQATVIYVEGEEIGSCSTSVVEYQTGPIDFSCDVPLPWEPPIPLEISGKGVGISDPFWLPAGSLIFQTTATPDRFAYAGIGLTLSTGPVYRLWSSLSVPTQTEVIRVYDRTQARINSTIDGPWRTVIEDAFP